MADIDHDLLIELKTMFKMAHDENRRAFDEHKTEDTKAFTEINMKVSAAHKRMDDLKKDMIDSIEALAKQMRGFGALKDKVMGGALVVMFLITTGLSILSILKK